MSENEPLPYHEEMTGGAEEMRQSLHKYAKIFVTTYPSGGGAYGGDIEADSYEEAVALAIKRNIGERVTGETKGTWVRGISSFLMSEMPTREDFLAAAHEACFLGYVALSSGAATPRELLGDTGLIHDLLHLAAGDLDYSSERKYRLILLAKDLEMRTPGWPWVRAGEKRELNEEGFQLVLVEDHSAVDETNARDAIRILEEYIERGEERARQDQEAARSAEEVSE